MSTEARSYEIDFLYTLTDFFVPKEGDDGEPELIRDMNKLSFAVHPDGTWSVSVGRHAALSPHIDATLHTLEGDASTTAPDLLRALAERIMAPHQGTAVR